MILRVLEPGDVHAREFAFHRAEALIGSGRKTDLCVSAAGIALRHARLRRREDRVWLEPLRAGALLVIERALVGRIKSTQAIPLLAGDIILLGEEPQRTTIELVAIQEEVASGPEAHTPYRLGDRLDKASPALLAATARFASATALATSWEALATALGELVTSATGTAGQPVGFALLGTAERPPERRLPDALEGVLAAHGALATGPGWRSPLSARLARGDVLVIGAGAEATNRASGEWPRVTTGMLEAVPPRRSLAVLVPIRGEDGLLGYWVFGAAEADYAVNIAPVADTVSSLLAGALERLELARERANLRQEIDYFRRRERRHFLFKELVTHSPAMRAVRDEVQRMVRSSGMVWILGEKGTGKEMIARAVHHLSDRADALMISQNCGAATPAELDAELFGRGPESGENGDAPCPGLLELARGGTLFLEEIDRLALHLQAKLLRAIQEHEVRPAGEAVGRIVDFGLVASSEQDLFPLVQSGAFRKDLYVQLARQVIRLPPLRQRREDVVDLAHVFLTHLAPRYQKAARRFGAAARAALEAYDWPGNVRELQAQVELALIGAPDEAETIERVPGLMP